MHPSICNHTASDKLSNTPSEVIPGRYGTNQKCAKGPRGGILRATEYNSHSDSEVGQLRQGESTKVSLDPVSGCLATEAYAASLSSPTK